MRFPRREKRDHGETVHRIKLNITGHCVAENCPKNRFPFQGSRLVFPKTVPVEPQTRRVIVSAASTRETLSRTRRYSLFEFTGCRTTLVSEKKFMLKNAFTCKTIFRLSRMRSRNENSRWEHFCDCDTMGMIAYVTCRVKVRLSWQEG